MMLVAFSRSQKIIVRCGIPTFDQTTFTSQRRRLEDSHNASPSDKGLYQPRDLALTHPLHTQQLVVRPLELPSKLLPPNSTLDEAERPTRICRLALGQLPQLHIRTLLQGLRLHHLRVPRAILAQLLRQRNQLVLRHDRILHVHRAVLRLRCMHQGFHNRFADAGACGGAEWAIAAVVQFRFFVLGVDDEPDHQTPVEDGPVEDEVVRHCPLCGLGCEEFLGGDFVAVYGEGLGFGVGGVGAELGGDDAVDTGGDGGVEDVGLEVGGEGAEGGDDGVLALEGGGDGRDGLIVDGHGFDGGGKGGLAGRPGEDGDMEGGGSESGED